MIVIYPEDEILRMSEVEGKNKIKHCASAKFAPMANFWGILAEIGYKELKIS
jgi:hypothetical protein